MASPSASGASLTSLIMSFLDRYLFQMLPFTAFPLLFLLSIPWSHFLPLVPPQSAFKDIFLCPFPAYPHPFPWWFYKYFLWEGPDENVLGFEGHMVLAAITHHLWYCSRKLTIDNVNKWAWLWLNKALFYKEATGHSWSTCHSLLTHLMPPMCTIHIANSHYCRN